MSRFDERFDEVMRMLDEEDAGAMGAAGYVDASVNSPGSSDAIYTSARPYRKRRLKKTKRNVSGNRRRNMKTPEFRRMVLK